MNMEHHEATIRNDLAAMREQMKAIEASPDTVFMERRILQRGIEHLEHKLIWIQGIPRFWKRWTT